MSVLTLGVDCSMPPTDDELAELQNSFCGLVAGYIGGNTPHVWTPDDWSRCRAHNMAVLPIWVAPNDATLHSDGADAGNQALEQMHAAGLADICVLDVEADFHVMPDYCHGFWEALQAGDCDLALYGIAMQIDTLSDRLFTWIANPQGPTRVLPDTAGVQLWFERRYDWSLWTNPVPSA